MKNVHGQVVPTFARIVEEKTVSFVVEAGSEGCSDEKGCELLGGSYLSLFCDSSAFSFSSIRDKWGREIGIELFSCGIEALDALLASLEFAVTALKDARNSIND